MNGTIQSLDDRCQRLELRSQQVLTAVETGNLQTGSILKALSAEGESSEKDCVSTATDGPAINREGIKLLISASRSSDERQAAKDCKKLLELFHDSSVEESIADKEKGNYSATISAIVPACWNFVAPHAAGIEQDLQQLDFLHLSVKDFIVTPYMQQFLMEHAGADFQPEYKLVQLFTAMARVVDVRGLDDEMRAFQFMADEALYYAKTRFPSIRSLVHS